MSNLQQEIIADIQSQYPKLMEGDFDQALEATVVVSNVLAGLLSLVRNHATDEIDARRMLHTAFDNIERMVAEVEDASGLTPPAIVRGADDLIQ